MQPRYLTLSTDGTCISNGTITKLNKLPKKQFTLHTPTGNKVKSFVYYQFKGIQFLIDVITGTLYNAKTGECPNSQLLWILDLHTQSMPSIEQLHNHGSFDGLTLSSQLDALDNPVE